MEKVTKEQYEYATKRIEELLPLVDGYDVKDKKAIELALLSDVVIAYEKEYFPIEKPTVAELIADGISFKGITQKKLASDLGVSPSRINDFIKGKSEPSLKQASLLCKLLDIQPAAILGL